MPVFRRHRRALVCCCVVAASARGVAALQTDQLAALDRTVGSAEESLRAGERQVAESRYRTALLEGWMLLGGIYAGHGQLADARHAFERASASAVENREALQSLAVVQLQMGDAATALDTLTRLASISPASVAVRRTLAQALIAGGKAAEAVQELEEAHALAPDDPELTFALASGYLRLDKLDAADRLFAQVAATRPLPQTYVLIGRTYRDFGYYDRARTALGRALKMDPRVRRAHYYLGTAAVMQEGVVRLDEAIAEFRQELRLSPGDPPTTLRLGMALTEARKYDEAMPVLESAVRVTSPFPDAWLYLGRCQLALSRASDAIASFRRALATATPEGPSASAVEQARLRTIHYQLATALRQTGAAADAEREFGEAQRLSARRAEAAREELAQYMADSPEGSPAATQTAAFPIDVTGFEKSTAAEREMVASRVRATLARAYLNLGIMQAQANRFARAAEVFEEAALIDPAFPQVQYSLGVAYFNAEQFDKAAAALTRALEQQPGNADTRRMLALAAMNAEDYTRAADLLRDDPKRASDPSLQYVYGLSLVRSNRAQEAEQIFSRVLAEHPNLPELNVALGQAYAAQGDYEAAVKSLRRAIDLKSDVAEANASLGVIYLEQGQLSAATASLRAELASHPDNLKARYTLATVLDLDGHGDDALGELRAIVAVKPTNADARYLFGKILLARGAAADAVAHLEVAARLAPDVPNIHYQLGLAYQRMGRTELAAHEFEIFQHLKDKKRGGEP
jgi:tetratricopeptide (TPR) repeat protein